MKLSEHKKFKDLEGKCQSDEYPFGTIFCTIGEYLDKFKNIENLSVVGGIVYDIENTYKNNGVVNALSHAHNFKKRISRTYENERILLMFL